MQPKAFRNIALLLGLSLVAVVGLQGYWLLYLYRQEQGELTRLAYRALNHVVDKLGEKENLLLIKQRISADTFSYSNPTADQVIISSTDKASTQNFILNKNGKNQAVTRYRVLTKNNKGKTVSFTWNYSTQKTPQAGKEITETERDAREAAMDKKYATMDSLDAILDTQYAAMDSIDAVYNQMEISAAQIELASDNSEQVLRQLNQTARLQGTLIDTAKLKKKEKELQELIKKLGMEIKLVESGLTQLYKADQVQHLLKAYLSAQGVDTPVECAVLNRTEDSSFFLSSTSGFLKNQPSYETNLSRDRLFQQGNFLLMQYAGLQTILFSRITRMLVLSLLFTLLMVGVFYASLHLLLKQKKLSEIRNDFVNNMTHELKTPIATISLATDALVQSNSHENSEKFREYIRILKEENQKLNSHVERVLQMALVEKGHLELNRSMIELKALSEACISSQKLQIQTRNAQVQLHAEKELWFWGDRLHLTNALNNLIDNALKYSSEQPQIQVELKTEKGKILWQVRDNGPGIAAGQTEKIFDKFYRIPKGDLHEVKGFGLGLSYVRSIVEAHGGRVSAKSETGKGTTFTIQLEATHEDPAGRG